MLGLRADGGQKRVDDVRISQGGSPIVGINGLCDELPKLIELPARKRLINVFDRGGGGVEELLGPLLTADGPEGLRVGDRSQRLAGRFELLYRSSRNFVRTPKELSFSLVKPANRQETLPVHQN